MKNCIWYLLLLFLIVSNPRISAAQCPDVLGSFGTLITPSQNPQWIGCGAGTFTVRFQMTADIFGPYTIDWGDGNVSNGSDLLSTSFVSHIYAPAVDTFTVVFTGACGTITGLVVMEEAVIASVKTGFGGVTKSCAPATLLFTNQSVHNSPTTTYTWDWGDGSPVEIYGPANYGDTIAHTFQRGTVDCETEVTLTANNFCTAGNPSENILRPIQVWDIDSAIIDASETLLCYPDTVVTFRNVSDLNCATPALGNTVQRFERWTFFDLKGPGQDSVIDWSPFPISLARTMAFPGPGTYTIELLDSNQCGIATQVIQIVITSPPVADFLSDDTICEGAQIAFQNISSNGANNFLWDFGDGTTSTSTNPNHFFQNSGNFTVSLTATIAGGSLSCRSTVGKNIVVLKAPEAGVKLFTDQGCDSLLVNFQDSSSSDVTNWSWNFGNSTSSTLQNPGNVLYDTAGAFKVELTVSTNEGCTDEFSGTVNVYLSPLVNITPSKVCQGLATVFKDQSIISPNDIISQWQWDFGDGTTSSLQNPVHTYLTSDTFDITLSISTLYCSNTEVVQVIVEPLPVANFTLDTIIGCSPLSVNTLNTSDSAGTVSLGYEWYVNGQFTSDSVNPNFLFSNTSSTDSNFQILLFAETSFGCRDSISRIVNVFPEVGAAFSFSGVNICNPDSVNFLSSVTPNVAGYLWDFGDGFSSNLANPKHLFVNDSLTILSFPVSLTAQSAQGCEEVFLDTVVIGPKATFDFSASPLSGCSPLSVNLSAELGAVTYSWNFGNGNPGFGQTAQTSFTSAKDTVFTISLRTLTAFGCRDTIQKQITVLGGSVADFGSSVSNAVCAPVQISFSDSSINAASYDWNFGDGNTSNIPNPSNTYFNDSSFALSFPVRLIVTSPSGCSDTLIKQVIIKPELKLELSFTPNNHCGPTLVNYNAIGSASSLLWEFGDGNTGLGPNVSHIYTTNADSLYPIRLFGVSSFNCRDTVFDTIRTRRAVIAGIGPSLLAPQCSPAVFNFENISQFSDQHVWDFGDGSAPVINNDSIVMHAYLNNGTSNIFRTVKLFAGAANGCVDSVQRNIEIYPKVNVAIISENDSICSGSSNSVMANAQISNANTYTWNLGNGSFGNGFSSSTSYFTFQDSVFQIILNGQSTQGCTDSDTFNLQVIRQGFANFNAIYSNPACSPLAVNFQNFSDSSFGFIWDFGNGQSSNSQFSNINQTYTNTDTLPIDFLASLILSPGEMCADTLEQLITVNPILKYEINANPTEGCSPMTVAFSGDVGALIYQWNFGNGQVANGQNAISIFSSSVDTVFNVRLVSTSPYQCKDTTTESIIVHPSAIADFSTITQPVCSPAKIDFFNLSDTLLTNGFIWNFGDGTIVNSDSMVIQHVFQNPGLNIIHRDVSLIATAPFGCNDTVSKRVSILPKPNFTISADNPEGCSPLNVEFTANGNAVNYYWTFSNGNSVPGVFSKQSFENNSDKDTVFTVRLIGQSDNGCLDTAYTSVKSLVKPIADFAVDSPIKNLPERTFQLFQKSLRADTYYWDFGDGTPVIVGSPQARTYAAHGEYLIKMVAENRTCYDTTSLQVLIKPLAPVADFEGFNEGCTPLSVNFTNFSQFAKTFEWDFGDGLISNLENPTHVYKNPGVYRVRLKAMNELDTVTIQYDSVAIVYDLPESRFSLNNPRDTVVFVPGKSIAFRNYSIAASTYLWDFGDGSISTELNPEKRFTQLGDYRIYLIAENEFSCRDSSYLDIKAIKGGSVAIPNAFSPNPDLSNGGNVNSSGVNDVFFPITDGVVTMHMQIFNRWGELIFESKRLDIGWDGYYRGNICKQDVYVYRIALEFIDGEKRVEVGDVTLLR